MRTRTNIFAALGCCLLLLFLVFAFARTREPKYEGRTVSDWMEVAGTNRVGIDALGQVGTNALPLLVKWLQWERSPWKQKLYNSFLRAPRFMQVPALADWLAEQKAQSRTTTLPHVFVALGANAVPIAPELLRISNSTRSSMIAWRTMVALACLGTNGLPQMQQLLRNPEHPHRAAAAQLVGLVLQDYPSSAKGAVPVLIECLTSSDPKLVVSATEALANANLDLRPMIPAFRKNLESTNAAVRAAAAEALNDIAPTYRTNTPAR